MPTILLLDVSLSMTRPVSMPDCPEEYQRRHLATHGINTLLDYCSSHYKLEFVSLFVFSSLWEQLSPFTRDYESVKAALTKVVDYDKTCLEAAMTGISSLVTEEWGNSTMIQVILITDGSTGVGEGSLKQSLENAHCREPPDDPKFPLPFPFMSRLLIVCIAPREEPGLANSIEMYEKLIEINNGEGELILPESPLTLKSIQTTFNRIGEKYYSPYSGALRCGHLKCPILIFPAPEIYKKVHDFDEVHREVRKEMEVCGFLDITDVASPPCLSRHLVLPTEEPKKAEDSSGEGEGDEVESETGKAAAFTVLLHGALKVEGMVAMVQVAEDWFGKMYSWADSKKKSNLMLALFKPGTDVIPWLGNLTHLAPVGDFAEHPYGEDDNRTPFPVRPSERRSYAQNCVVWIKPSGLQADIQKILRHARKLPEKQQHFYKELNRLRRAALSLGFHELMEKVSILLDRECTLLPGNAHPDAALQLSHAASMLRSPSVLDINTNVMPLRTNFSGD